MEDREQSNKEPEINSQVSSKPRQKRDIRVVIPEHLSDYPVIEDKKNQYKCANT